MITTMIDNKLDASNALIELVSLHKKHDGKVVIPELSLIINHGEFITLLGPSGCGKTTVLRLIAGLDRVDNGSIILDGRDITHVVAEKRQTNTVFQSYALFPHLTVFDNIAFGLRMQRLKPEDIERMVKEILDMVQLSSMAKRRPHQLSGGQQQRVAIARAVVNKPKVLLLDESLSALDYRLRRQMQNELKLLQRKLGITFIFVTHDQEEALSMSDRIIVMDNGCIIQDGTPRQIYEEPSNLFVAKFIGDTNIFDAYVIRRIDTKRILCRIEGQDWVIWTELIVTEGEHLNVLLRPEDIIITVLEDGHEQIGLIGYVRSTNYKGMILESEVELENGKTITVCEFFNEDAPEVNHSINQKVAIRWIENWEVVLRDENANVQ